MPEVSNSSSATDEDCTTSADERPEVPSAFTVVLARPQGGHAAGTGGGLGLSIRCSGGSLVVDEIMGGAAASWNACNLDPLQNAASLVGHALLDAAMDTVVDPSEAMHPERAECGLELLKSAASDLKSDKRAAKSPPRPITSMRSGFLCSMQESSVDRAAVERLFFDSMPRRHVRIDCVETVVNPALLKRFLERVAKEEGCVEATFHGTRQESSEAILRDGLVPDKNGIAAYGHGVYVGTHAGVAHQYATPDESGRRHMCVVLAVVGSRVVKGAQGTNSSVTALDRLVNPTQYCVVDADRLLVSHLITYRVVQRPPRRIGGGFEDPFQRRLSRAVERSGRSRQRRGLR